MDTIYTLFIRNVFWDQHRTPFIILSISCPFLSFSFNVLSFHFQFKSKCSRILLDFTLRARTWSSGLEVDSKLVPSSKRRRTHLPSIVWGLRSLGVRSVGPSGSEDQTRQIRRAGRRVRHDGLKAAWPGSGRGQWRQRSRGWGKERKATQVERKRESAGGGVMCGLCSVFRALWILSAWYESANLERDLSGFLWTDKQHTFPHPSSSFLRLG